MLRKYLDVTRIRGEDAEKILKALESGLPLEFEHEDDCIVVRLVLSTKPECVKDFHPITP